MSPAGWLLTRFGSVGGGGVLPTLDAYSPATIVAGWIVARAFASGFGGAEDAEWPIYVSATPPEPDDVLSTYDTSGLLPGRKMRTGVKIEKQGVQIRARASDYDDAFAKLKQIQDAIDLVARTTVTFGGGESFRIDNISRTSGITSIGQEPETRRALLVLNVRISFTPL